MYSGINLSPASKNLFTILFISYTQWNCILNKVFNNGILLNIVLIPKLLNKISASCCFTNLHFLDPHSAYFDCLINLLLLFQKALSLHFKYFSYTLCNKIPFSFKTYIRKQKNVLVTAHFIFCCYVFALEILIYQIDKQQLDFSLSTLFVIFISCDLKLSV